ncbi:MAG: hypothetical protein PHY54_12175 [Methylococcales bacterium]|nr:hypothetical protein [Methylococcales bacterium]
MALKHQTAYYFAGKERLILPLILNRKEFPAARLIPLPVDMTITKINVYSFPPALVKFLKIIMMR